MDPATGKTVFDQWCEVVSDIRTAVQDLQQQVTNVEGRLRDLPTPPCSSSLARAPVVIPEPRVPLPDRFSGDRCKFQNFKRACLLHFTMLPRTYADERAKVNLIISLLRDDPQTWALRLWEQDHASVQSVEAFFSALANLYDDPGQTASAVAAIRSLRQRGRPVEEYVSDFYRWSEETLWNEPALRDQFRYGLSEDLKDELARVGVPPTLRELVQLAIQIDRRFRERAKERRGTRGRGVPALSAPPAVLSEVKPQEQECEPMLIGTSPRSLSEKERQRRRSDGLCFYCGEPGHTIGTCRLRLKGKGSEEFSGGASPYAMVRTHLVLSFQGLVDPIEACAIVDSGACSSFIDLSFARRMGIPMVPRSSPLTISLADGSPLASGPVNQQTIPLEVLVPGRHREVLQLDVIPSPNQPVVLGLPWLRTHNPCIDWPTGRIQFPSRHCSVHCGASGEFLLSLDSGRSELVPSAYHEFLDVFDKKGADALPPHRIYDCPIELQSGAKIPYGRVYPLSEPETKVLKEYIEENLKKGFIVPSTSSAGAGIFFVGKKDGSLRPCIDYRELNNITIKNRYPLPLFPDLFRRLGSAKIFSKLDLRGAYNLIRIRKGDEWKTAFRSQYGHFEYKVMPFGLCNAPATFQYFVNDIFRDFIDDFMVVYLDDILVFSSTLEEHRIQLKKVLGRLRTHRLYAKAEKCEFEKDTIQFLGFCISPEGVAMDSQKVSAILDWPVPTDKKGVQRFIGFANFYRKFIKGFSSIVAPITSLTKKNSLYRWSTEAQQAFDKLKKVFVSAPVLKHADPALPFTLEVDASASAIGAVLSQRLGPQSLLHPVAYFSRKLSPAERNYDVGDRELLAIKAALEEWRYLLEGARNPVTILTDHKNLEYLRSAKRLRPRQARWALFFSRFDFHITYRPGSKNGKPDALSRMFEEGDSSPKQDETILSTSHFLMIQPKILTRIRDASKKLPGGDVAEYSLENGVYFKDSRVVVPEDFREEVLKFCHDHRLAGHFGVAKTLDLLKRSFFWPEMVKDCDRYVQSCPVCARSKKPRVKPLGLLSPLPIPSRPWDKISLDFIVELPPSQGFSSILVVVDRLTKMAHFVPLKGVPSAAETAESVVKEIIRLHGLPSDIVSDRGVQFTSKFWQELCSQLQIQSSLSSGYHPQSNGQTERTNQTLEQYIRCFISATQDDWVDLLPTAEFAYNNAVHSSTGFSPFFANYGYHPTTFPQLQEEASVPSVQERLDMISRNLSLMQDVLKKTQERVKKFADRKRSDNPEWQVGDQVWLSTLNLRLKCPSKKLGPKFIGPFTICQKINPVAFKLELPANLRIHPVFHVSCLKKVVPNQFPGRSPATPEPVLVDGEEEFEVEKILDSRRRGRTVQYLVHWKGYGPEDNSWVSHKDLHAPKLLEAFHGAFPEKPVMEVTRRLPLRGGQCHTYGSRAPAPPSSSHAVPGGSRGRRAR